MNTTDPIADMLTRIRNANTSKHKTVDVPASKIKVGIAEILYREGYIKSFEQINDNAQGTIRITLKYGEKGAKVIDSVLMPGAVVEEGAVVTRALVAENVKIGKRAKVGSKTNENITLVAKNVKGGNK